MTPPEFTALADMLPRGPFLNRDSLADLHRTMKEHGMFEGGDGR